MSALLYVFLGGGLGSLCRYSLGIALRSTHFPYGTLVANIIACTILGILMGLSIEQLLSTPQRLLLMTGFCGGFSTFSTFSGEIVTLYQDGHMSTALIYALGSVILGVGCIFLGLAIAKIFS